MAAAGCTIHQTGIARIEAATRPTSVGEIATLATLFGLPPGALYDEELTRREEIEVRIDALERDAERAEAEAEIASGRAHQYRERAEQLRSVLQTEES